MSEINDLAEAGGKIFAVRGQGLMIAFDVATGEIRDKVIEAGLAESMLLLSCGETSIRFRPYLIFDDAARAVLMTGLKKIVESI
jgi:L-lysine 6-transaminase